MKKVTLVYIHGLNGHNSKKALQLKEHFEKYTVITPKLSKNPSEVIKKLEGIFFSLISANNDSSVYIVGSSLGGFYSLYFSAIYGHTVFLVNPSLHPEVSLVGKVSNKYIEQFKLLQDTIKYSKYTNRFINAFLAKDDEILDHSEFIDTFKNIHTLKLFDNVGHRFNNFDMLVIPLIDDIINTDEKIDFSEFDHIF